MKLRFVAVAITAGVLVLSGCTDESSTASKVTSSSPTGSPSQSSQAATDPPPQQSGTAQPGSETGSPVVPQPTSPQTIPADPAQPLQDDAALVTQSCAPLAAMQPQAATNEWVSILLEMNDAVSSGRLDSSWAEFSTDLAYVAQSAPPSEDWEPEKVNGFFEAYAGVLQGCARAGVVVPQS